MTCVSTIRAEMTRYKVIVNIPLYFMPMDENEVTTHTSPGEGLAGEIPPAPDRADPAGDAAPDGVRFESIVILPPLARTRPSRPPLVPKAVYFGLAAAFGVLVVTIGLVLLLSQLSAVAVPDLTGKQLSVAKTELQRIGLRLSVAEKRFSTVPEGQVLTQSPGASGSLKKGQTVRVVVSAGTEEFAMPDVIGDGLSLARGTLEARGLILIVETVTSELASDTVIGTVPAPGATVRTGERIKVQVASATGSTTSLQPFRMAGLAVVIDPAPGITVDPSLDVARRLRALLEASGATVHMTRTGSDTSTAEPDRAARVAAASSTVGIGLQITEAGAGGRIISAPATMTPFIGPTSAALGNALERAFSGALEPYTRVPPSTSDPVLGNVNIPWTRLTLGSMSAPDDAASFSDPAWADVVARAIYRALGEVYGTREAQ